MERCRKERSEAEAVGVQTVCRKEATLAGAVASGWLRVAAHFSATMELDVSPWHSLTTPTEVKVPRPVNGSTPQSWLSGRLPLVQETCSVRSAHETHPLLGGRT